MYDDPIRLRNYSTNQLIEELSRRANGRRLTKPEYWCHDCKNYVTWSELQTPGVKCPDEYNPCQKKHEMQFVTPEDIDDKYGYYRSVCGDRNLNSSDE